MIRERLQRGLRSLNDAWFRPDLRTLALFRMAFGLLVIIDVARRMPYIALMYSDQGVLPNPALLEHPFSKYTFSLLLSLGTPGEAAVLFWVTLIAAFMFLVGWRTKAAHVVMALGVLSIHNKNILVENGGDQVMNIYVLWTLFLPLAERFSVDAILRSMRQRRETSVEHLSEPGFVPRAEIPLWRLAYLACLVQLSVIYFFNTVSKSGETWTQGTSIYYLLHQDRQITDLGLWMREWAPLWVSKLITFATLAIEGALPVLIMLPMLTWSRRRLLGLGILVLIGYAIATAMRLAVYGRLQDHWPYALLPIAVLAPLALLRSTRAVAFLHVIALHVGIAAVANVGLFSWAMICAGVLLLSTHDVDWLARHLRRLSRGPVSIQFDASTGIVFALARLARRLDVFGLLLWQGDTGGRALVARREGDAKQLGGHDAVIAVVEALPFGRILGFPLRLAGLGAFLVWPLAALARRRSWAQESFAHPPATPSAPPILLAPATPTRMRRFASTSAAAFGGACVLFMMAACTTQMLNTNRFFTHVIPAASSKHLGTRIDLTVKQPPAFQKWVTYTRMFQRWNMFAPNVPKSEGWVVIDAKLADGRRIDPQTGAPPQFGAVDKTAGVDFGQMWRIYTKRIAKKQYKHFRKHLRNYLLNRHRVEGLPDADRITEFDVWWIRDVSPAPGAREVAPKEKTRFKITSFHPGEKQDDATEESEDDTPKSRSPRKSETTSPPVSRQDGAAPATRVGRSTRSPVPPAILSNQAHEAIQEAIEHRRATPPPTPPAPPTAPSSPSPPQ